MNAGGAARLQCHAGVRPKRLARFKECCVPPSSQIERDWVVRAKRGDARVLGEIYEAFAARLFAHVLLPRLGDRAAAEEALAETFRTALERWPRYEDRGVSVYFWLARIAMSKAMDMHRDGSRTGRALVSFEALLGPLRTSPEDPAMASEREDLLAALRERVADVLGKVHERYGRALKLRIFEERTREDCAAALDVTVPTFDVIFLRALRAFRKAWETAS
jgi:RNA polymerase sigma factor (sigma-70 family)